MVTSIHYKPPTKTGGLSRVVTDHRRYEAAAPVWFGGLAIQRDGTDQSLAKIWDTNDDLRQRIMGAAVSGTDPNRNYGEKFTDYDHIIRGDISAFNQVAVALVGIFSMPVDSDFSTAFVQGDQLGLVVDSHVWESSAGNLPSLTPFYEEDEAGSAYGATWVAAVITDGEPVDGLNLRDIMQKAGCQYVGQSDQDVGATPGDVNIDVILMLGSPVFWVPSA
ncbi:hypothetical protein LCGC14_0267320 [marine sediment metagenome]|uniref:Uncharacterized protein n=1 Tax=marine sediment metagenome TaxID=412755 RepID=A0A0F9WKL4_9ZZZZ